MDMPKKKQGYFTLGRIQMKNVPIPKIEACSRYWRDIMHCWLLDNMTIPKEKAPIDAATPKNV